MNHAEVRRRLAVGAELVPRCGTHYRVWAPRREHVAVVLAASGGNTAGDADIPLQAEGNGYFSALATGVAAGTLYRFRLGDDDTLYPDPASRFQPQGPHGPSQVVDPAAFEWTDQEWPGLAPLGQVVYELHVGTFTPEGTWRAAAQQLAELVRTGVTALEIMPVADFAGRYGWGYDGVNLFAPTRLYGTPDDFRSFVDRAHALGLGVILDVVYNHFGPDGCYLRAYSSDYFTDKYDNEWGDAINFDGPNAGPVRELICSNAAYWIEEFHLDGLRLDATQQMFDSSQRHIIGEVVQSVRKAGGARRTLVIAENEPQDVRVVRAPEEGGYGADGLWNDDFHHSACVAATGRNEGYYTDYAGAPQELVSLAKRGYLYQGQRYRWQGKRRGTATFGLAPAAFVNYLQNHDQVANSASGARIHQLTSPGTYRAMTAYLLLSPGTPLLFQGQEFAASSPFLFFADHKPELMQSVRSGRAEFLSQFPTIATHEIRASLADPGADGTFQRCKLDFSERERHREAYALHCDLLRLRREDPVFSAQRGGGVDGAVLSPAAFVLRYFGEASGDRLLLINLGGDLHLPIAPEPLLAPPGGREWDVLWSSEHPRYGGGGTPALEGEAGWRIPARAAIVLTPAAGAQEVTGTQALLT